MTRHLLLAAMLAALAATSAAADTPPASNATSPPTTVAPAKVVANRNDPNAVVCKYEQETGSRIPGPKTCMTRAQWTQQSEDARTATDQSQAGALTVGPPIGKP